MKIVQPTKQRKQKIFNSNKNMKCKKNLFQECEKKREIITRLLFSQRYDAKERRIFLTLECCGCLTFFNDTDWRAVTMFGSFLY